ncbi:hypothetical protein [Pseudomonas sp. NPDC087614]|uniref:hypothetical protein n=1 Tax=Pseudomonas sp. NPDC087614 TaxID=3364442 RepID=UPI003810DDDB
MSIVRKPATTSSTIRSPADVDSPRRRPGNPLDGDGPAIKNFRPDAEQAHMEVARDPGASVPAVPAVTITPLLSAGILPVRPEVKTLEHYLLKPPEKLAEANAQGFRVVKGRLYVDIAPGKIAQVRRDRTSGEYRATLLSELEPSGPVLFFEPQSKTWKLERDRIHTGKDDVFELGLDAGTTLVARGLRQFPAEQAAIIRSELRVVQSTFSDASRAIALKYQEADAVYESYFGTDHQSVSPRFSECVSRGLAVSKEYQGFWGDDKFLGVDTAGNHLAWMYKGDFHGRVFINRKYLRAGALSLTLGHEMLHTNRIDRFAAIGPNASDYFYLGVEARAFLTSEPLTVYDVPERGVSEVIMRGGLTAEYLNVFMNDHSEFLSGVSHYLGMRDVPDLQTAVDLFNANPQMRAHMAANNADSIICATKSMQELHRSKTEYAWLDSLIEDL